MMAQIPGLATLLATNAPALPPPWAMQLATTLSLWAGQREATNPPIKMPTALASM